MGVPGLGTRSHGRRGGGWELVTWTVEGQEGRGRKVTDWEVEVRKGSPWVPM